MRSVQMRATIIGHLLDTLLNSNIPLKTDWNQTGLLLDKGGLI